MAKFSPTPAQSKAIEAPIMDLLVSAAAGSGKTAVLSQRILRLILSHASICMIQCLEKGIWISPLTSLLHQ